MRLSVEKTRHASGWRKNAREKFGTERADIVIEETNALYERLCAESSGIPPEKREHMYKNIYPLAALYMTLRRYAGDDALSLAREWFIESVKMQANGLRKYISDNDMAASFPKAFADEMRRAYSCEAGFEIEFITENSFETRFNVYSCLYHDVCASMGIPELCRIFCLSDEVCYSELHESLHWSRTQTLAYGSYCDFGMRYKATDTGACGE